MKPLLYASAIASLIILGACSNGDDRPRPTPNPVPAPSPSPGPGFERPETFTQYCSENQESPTCVCVATGKGLVECAREDIERSAEPRDPAEEPTIFEPERE